MDKKAVSRRIRSLCVDRGVTYKDMAAAIGVAEGTMKSWIYGERTMTLENAFAIADFFKVPLDEIACRTVPVTPVEVA